MDRNERHTAHSFRVPCPIGAAYKACVNALAAMPNVDVGCTDEDTCSIEASVRCTLWSRGEDLRILISPAGDAEAIIDIGSDAKHWDKDNRNYDDLECAVRCQISRLSI